MTYREKLELYRNRKLDDAINKQVEEDIEKHKAISDYIYDDIESEHSDFINVVGLDDKCEEETEREKNFTRKVNQSIRRAFIRAGVIILVVTIAIVLFIILALPRLVSLFYYDPSAIVEGDTNQMSLDMSVYTELYTPGYIRDNVSVTDNGYGNYDIVVNQNISYNSFFNNVVGKVEKDRITLYNPDVIRRPIGNSFGWFQADLSMGKTLTQILEKENEDITGGGDVCHGPYINKESAENSIEKFQDDTMYIGYVTLDKMMSYNEFYKFLNENIEGNSIWCAVKTQNTPNDTKYTPNNIGFSCSFGESTSVQWDDKKYSHLKLFADKMHEESNEYHLDEEEKMLGNEEYMKTHFLSMLKYMSDQKDFTLDDKDDKSTYNQMVDYIEKNGLIIYGFALITTKENLKEINNLQQVFGVYAQELR